MTQKPDFCKNCPINKFTEGYVLLCVGSGSQLFVGEASDEEEAKCGKPFVGGAGQWFNSMLRSARISRPSINIINTIGCRPPDNVYPSDPKWERAVKYSAVKKAAEAKKRFGEDSDEYRKAKDFIEEAYSPNAEGRAGVDYCREHHLRPVLDNHKWSRIVALGDHALRSLTGRQGILLWRGSPLPLKGRMEEGPKVMPTLHPAFLMRSANLFSVAVRDLQRPCRVPPENYNLWPKLAEVQAFDSKRFAFDFEWDEYGNITLCGLSDRYYHAITVPWTREFIPELKRIFEQAEELIGHNIIGADTKWFDQLGWTIKAKLYDTMLIQHLVQPDMRHGLAFVGSVFTSKVFWKGSGEEKEDADGNYLPTGAQWKTWNSPDAIPREFGGYGGCNSQQEAFRLYNARDTDGSLQCFDPLWQTLKNYGMENVYWNVSAPASFICRELGDRGLRLDVKRIKDVREDLEKQIGELEQKLPDGLKPQTLEVVKQIPAPKGTFKPKIKKCKGNKKSGTLHPPIDIIFETPNKKMCPVCRVWVESGRMQELKKIKVPGVEVVRPWNSTQQVLGYAKRKGCKVLVHAKTGNETADKNARKVWGRTYTEFALVDQLKKLGTLKNSFLKEALLKEEFVYFNLLVHGTSEGRLSSSGKREGLDPNIQNQPKEVRKIYIPDYPEWGILAADIVQGENMLTAWLAKDWERWERLNTVGFDEHSYMASQFFNRPIELVMKGGVDEYLRKPGKVINHGRNYGLGAKKTLDYLAAEGFFYSLKDIEEMIEIWKKVNWRTAEWQKETAATAAAQSFLENPFGRRRWFQSRDYATKSLAFLPASTLADMVLRMMTGLYPIRFAQEIEAMGVRRAFYPKDWSLRIQVHDELTSQGPHDLHLEAARAVKEVMTQSWKELGGFAFRVDMAYSQKSWGDCKPIEV